MNIEEKLNDISLISERVGELKSYIEVMQAEIEELEYERDSINCTIRVDIASLDNDDASECMCCASKVDEYF